MPRQTPHLTLYKITGPAVEPLDSVYRIIKVANSIEFAPNDTVTGRVLHERVDMKYTVVPQPRNPGLPRLGGKDHI